MTSAIQTLERTVVLCHLSFLAKYKQLLYIKYIDIDRKTRTCVSMADKPCSSIC